MTQDTDVNDSSGIERGPRLLAWWEDYYGRQYQFLQDGDWFGLRSRDSADEEWVYSGTWVADNERYGPADTEQ